MVRVSTNITASLVALFLLGTTVYGQNQAWPVKRQVDLSSGFGDFRANRFHAGVDLRTGGAIGTKIYSPVDGYIWRVKMSYRGYGKGLYIKGDDEHFYVFAHLSRFNKTIQNAVIDHQFERERYYVDIYFPKDSIPVKQGDLIGYSGETGIGAPHLHFEKRSPDNVPINPLSHGFELEDKVPPTFERIGLHLLDTQSLFEGGYRRVFYPVSRVSSGRYRLDSVLHLSAPFGLLAHCYDQKRVGGMRQAVRRLTMLIDSVPYYESTLDSLPFAVGPVVNLVYDPLEAAHDEKRVRRLYRPLDHDVIRETAGAVYGGDLPGRGAYGLASPARYGKHRVEIIGEDVAGNRTVLEFDFVWVQDGTPSSLSRRGDYRDLVEDDFEVVDYDITEHGLVTEISQNDAVRHLFFKQQRLVDSKPEFQDLVMVVHQGRMLANGISMATVGFGPDSVLTCDNQLFRVTLPASKLYGARYLGASIAPRPAGVSAAYASRVYELLPLAFPVKSEFEIAIRLPAAHEQAGLCWYDEKESEWVWIDDNNDAPDLVVGSSLGGGLYAALIDTTAPTISKLNLKSGHKYWNRQPRVKAVIEDNLSGFDNDLNIDARVDGEYILPELDFESSAFVGLMRRPLALGRHELVLIVTDRAGNRAEQRVSFDVIKKQ